MKVWTDQNTWMFLLRTSETPAGLCLCQHFSSIQVIFLWKHIHYFHFSAVATKSVDANTESVKICKNVETPKELLENIC